MPEGESPLRRVAGGPGLRLRPFWSAFGRGFYATTPGWIQKDGRWLVEGDPTEGALIVSAAKAGLKGEEMDAWPRTDVIPFESERAYMASLHDPGDGKPPVAYVKGAVEKILEQSAKALTRDGAADDLDRDSVLEAAEAMAGEGLRVLAFARKEFPAQQRAFGSSDDLQGLTFLGLQGMIDPPRQEAMKAIEACKTAGVSVKMITGDHAVTASAIAAQLGLTDPVRRQGPGHRSHRTRSAGTQRHGDDRRGGTG